MNHSARRANHPSEYQPVARIPKRIIADPDRKAYWCHLCYCSRLNSTGMDLHYEQAHPTQARDASSRLHTTYTESRHGRPGELQNVERHSLTQVASAAQEHSKKRKRPTAQLRPDRSRYAPPCIVDEIPLLFQPPTLQRSLPGYCTGNNSAFATPQRAGTETPSLAPDSPSRKRQRLSDSDCHHAERAAKDRGGYFDDSGSEDGDGDIPHDAPCVGIWNGIGMGVWHANSNETNNELSASATDALEAGAAYEGEGQGWPDFYPGIDVDLEGDVDAATPSETATDGEISAMEMLVRRMFLKQAELRDLIVEAMELVRAEAGAVA